MVTGSLPSIYMFSKLKLIAFLVVFLPLFVPNKVNAAVLINEISPSTDTEWVELYNDGDIGVDLTGYRLEDGNSVLTDDINLSGQISSKSFLVFNHAEGWLNNGGDTVKLYNNATPSAVIDQYTYGDIDQSKSVARIPNGSGNWQTTSNVTNNSTNPTPTPSPTPSPTQSPTPTPLPTPLITKSPSPTPVKTKTPSPKPTSTPEVLGVESGQSYPTPEPTVEAEPTTVPTTTKKTSIIIMASIFIGVGVILTVVAGILIVKKIKSEQPLG